MKKYQRTVEVFAGKIVRAEETNMGRTMVVLLETGETFNFMIPWLWQYLAQQPNVYLVKIDGDFKVMPEETISEQFMPLDDEGDLQLDPRLEIGTPASEANLALRDQFALASIVGLADHAERADRFGDFKHLAKNAYKMADAMLAAREGES